ncbi:MAG: hypothetical protein H7Y11_04550 [Armatimonadetes bacterium]|nr:hypothetical protein [Anaerolineae bacterium]
MFFDEFGQFFNQLPPALTCNIAVMFIGLMVLLAYFAFIKPMRGQRSLKATQASQSASISAPPTPAMPVAVPPMRQTSDSRITLADGRRANSIEVLAVLRDTDDQRLMVLVDGVGYRTLADTPAVKAKFTALMRELSETIVKPDTATPDIAMIDAAPPVSAMPAAPIAKPARRILDDDLDMPDLDALTSLPEPAPKAKRNSAPPPVAADGSVPGALPNYRKIEPAAPRTPQPPVPALNLAGAIEAYLQHKLNYTPDYRGRAFHIHAAPGGGVVIQVDDLYYEAVSDIEDPDIRDFMAEMIDEWQSQQG